MSDNDQWIKLLHGHPIFSFPKSATASTSKLQNSLELSTNTLSNFTNADPEDDFTPSGRRQVMLLKDADLIVAAGKEIRMSSFGDLKLSSSVRKTYKTLHTPNVQFEVHQIALNPSGKLLAVVGAFQVAVIVLPRNGYSRLVSDTIDCKAVQVGQFYHASKNSAPVAKVEWHPWGESGSTLLVMTVDGKLREYDISIDTEEPQQVLTFVPEQKTKSFKAIDDSEREVASFTLGKGRADWGPLTVYAIMKSGDIYSICPYMPHNASIPSSYVHSLECFISAKQEFLLQGSSSGSKNLSTIYDYQHKYVTGLVKQLPPGTIFPAESKTISMHHPTTIKSPPLVQGPFLLQPSPRTLEGSEGGDATDITYLSFRTSDNDPEDDTNDTEHLGVMLVSFQEGRVDLFLDVEKVEARWDIKQTSNNELPILAIYETIDLGLIASLSQVTANPNLGPLIDLLRGNHPVFLLDPLHDEKVYVYHAFGVHALDLAPVLQNLAAALREENEDESILQKALETSRMTNVQPLLSTFSVERKCSNPVIGVAIPNDVYISYSIFILTSAMRVTAFPLNIRSELTHSRKALLLDSPVSGVADKNKWFIPLAGPPLYISSCSSEIFTPADLPTSAKLSLPDALSGSQEFTLTPDTLRFIGRTAAQMTSRIHDINLAYRAAHMRVQVHGVELQRQCSKCMELDSAIERLKGPTRQATAIRISKIQEAQKSLLARLDRLLQSLMEKASPELSEHETKWFEELKRMKADILGRGRYDEDSLVLRTRMLEKEYARILPPLQTFAEKEAQIRKKHTETAQNLGFSQAFEYGQRSNFDRTRISSVTKEISKLAAKLDIPLSQPPPT